MSDATRATILFVDDSPTMRGMIRMALPDMKKRGKKLMQVASSAVMRNELPNFERFPGGITLRHASPRYFIGVGTLARCMLFADRNGEQRPAHDRI